MGSVGDDFDKGKSVGGNSVADIGQTETQNLDTQSSSSLSGEKLIDANVDEVEQNTVPFGNTAPLESSLFETQLVNLENDTQVLDDTDTLGHATMPLKDECKKEVNIDSDGEDTDRTEVLSVSDSLSDGDSERVVGSDPVDLEKSLCSPFGLEVKDFVANSDMSTGGLCSSGIVQRNFTSVHSASLRTSGLAARSMSLVGSDNVLDSIPSEDGGISGIRDSSSSPAELRGVCQDHNTLKCNGSMKGIKAKSQSRVGSSTVRKLFTEDTLSVGEESTKNTESIKVGKNRDKLPAWDHELAGLSYVGSEEPGESSQANALDVVDKFLLVNNVELSEDVHHGKAPRGKSPPVASIKGPQKVAMRSKLRSPILKVGTFDWVDSCEDEGGGDFFSRKKGAFFDDRDRGQKSFTHPQKPRHVNFKRGRNKVDEIIKKEDLLNPQKKIMTVTHSDSKLPLRYSKENDKIISVSEMEISKSLVKEMDEMINAESSGKQLEACESRGDDVEIPDVGFDTQMAAEAMEALHCGVSVNHDVDDVYQRNASKSSSRGIKKNKAHSKPVSGLKRAHLSDSGCITRWSKRKKRPHTKLTKEAEEPFNKQSELNPKSAVKTKGKRGASFAEKQFNLENASSGSRRSCRRSNMTVEEGKSEKGADRACFEKLDSSWSTSDGQLSLSERHLQEEGRASTPVAHRTRQSVAVNLLKKDRTINLREFGSIKDKGKRSRLGVDAVKELTTERKCSKLVSTETRQVGEIDQTQHEQPGLETTNMTNFMKRDAQRYPEGRKSLRNTSDDVNGAGNIVGPSMVLNEKKANAQSITKQRAISDVRNGNLDMKKKRRSFVYCHQRLFSAENDSERSISKQNFDKSNSIDDAFNSNFSIVRKKVISEDLVGVKASMNSNREDEDSILSAGGIKKKADSEVSPKVKAKPPGSACSTPLNCATPINVASPVCTGDDYHRDLGKKSLSRSSLWRELSKLDAIEAMPAPKYKESRKRKDMTNIRVLFSQHLDEDIIKQQKKILARLGVSVASSSSDSTHFVTDKFVRTRNMLEAIALGKPVVTPLWLESCGQASCFIDEKNYIMRDARKEKAIGFSMPVSLARACQRPLLQGQRVFVTPNVKPSKELIASLVKAVHGQAVERIGRSTMKDDKIPDDLLVLSCEEDYAICVPFLEKGAAVYSSELLLNGIVIQKLEYERHRLFSDNVKRTRSTVWLRKEAGDRFLPVNKCK